MWPYLEYASQVVLLPALLLVLGLLARRIRPRRTRVWKSLSSAFTALSARPALCAVVLCAPPALSAVLFTAVHGIPIPAVHDEFSYLLAAETFASGRMTNPTHPMWTHFESFHIIHLPTYMSMYPPLQGLVLAAGILAGHPYAGVLFSSFAAILLVWWAARQWLPPRWALLAAIMGTILFTGTSWTLSYWGGAANAAAGALASGAAGMLRKRLTARGLALFSLGALLCGASRMYEGAVLCSILSCWLIYNLIRNRPARSVFPLKSVLPAALIVVLGAALLLSYNRAVTGNPLILPYQVAYQQYFHQGRFVFEKASQTAVHRHPTLADAYRKFNRPGFRPLTRLYYSYMGLQRFYLGIPLFTLLALSLAALRFERTRAAILTAIAGVAALLPVPVIMPHYFAPFAALFLVAATQAVRLLPRLFMPSQAHGWLAGVLLLALLSFQFGDRMLWAYNGPGRAKDWAYDRARIERDLLSLPGQDLVLVRYGPKHGYTREWVYNHPDIDSSGVVWARAMDDENDAKLRRYFASRRAWLLDADAKPPRLTALHPPAAP
jgi:hypothetical protein